MLDTASFLLYPVAVPSNRGPFYEELGARVARLRQDRRLSQAQLGEMVAPRMTRASIANIETGKQRVLAHTLVQLAAALRCDLDALVGPRDEAGPEADAVQRELERKLLQEEKLPKSVVEGLTRRIGLTTTKRRKAR